MKDNFEAGQLVRNRHTKDLGVVRDVKPDYYGATQAFKVYDAQPGQVIRPGSENGIGPTKDGIRDRVLVRWVTDYEKDRSWAFSWHDGKNIEIVEDESGLPSL